MSTATTTGLSALYNFGTFREIRLLMQLAMRFKVTRRNAWDIGFPKGHKCTTRKVENSESDADHSWALSFFALMIMDAFELQLDKLKVISMIIVHDLVEILSDDTVWITEPPEKQVALKKLKARKEEWAMQQICMACPILAPKIKELCDEYDRNESAEAQFAHQLNKFEPCIQAVEYYHEGGQVNPREFFRDSRPYITDPLLLEIYNDFEAHWQDENYWKSIQIPKSLSLL